MYKYALSGMAFAALAFTACQPSASTEGKRETTPSGLEYVFHQRGDDTTRASLGDVLTLQFVMKTESDSVLRNTHDEPMPIMFPLSEPQFQGSLEEGLAMMRKGDSATFYVSGDSLFAGGMRPDFIKEGSKLSFSVKLLNIQDQETAMAEQQRMADEQQAVAMQERQAHVAIDDSLIEAYAKENNLQTKVTDSGLHYVVEREGQGPKPQPGQTVRVSYELTTLDGKKIDSSYDRNEPLAFTLGQGQVIPGWDEGIALMREGSKGKLIVPSRLGYNEQPLGDRAPAFSVLVFNVELVEVQKN